MLTLPTVMIPKDYTFLIILSVSKNESTLEFRFVLVLILKITSVYG
jgi:hypothetical protein